MGLKFKKTFAHKSNYGAERKTRDIKYIVIHYTGNQGDSAVNNTTYFQGANRNASAHYFVDGGTYVYKLVPVTSIAWSVGGCYTLKNGAGTYYKKCTNANSISTEMCNSVRSVPWTGSDNVNWKNSRKKFQQNRKLSKKALTTAMYKSPQPAL